MKRSLLDDTVAYSLSCLFVNSSFQKMGTRARYIVSFSLKLSSKFVFAILTHFFLIFDVSLRSQGECDLVVVHSDSFHGKGLDMHVRTTIMDWYSYIEAAALRIGDHIVEVSNGKVTVNGLDLSNEDFPVDFGDKYSVSFSVEKHSKNEKYDKKHYVVSLGDDSSIEFKTYKHYMTFNIIAHDNDFGDANGLLGSHPTGEMLSRDGMTMTSFDEFAMEWQVNLDDPALFQDARSPQLPYEVCRMPTKARTSRQLRANRQLLAQAEDACATQNGKDFTLCVNDVMATGDLGLADIW
jgi:hypothetical protein